MDRQSEKSLILLLILFSLFFLALPARITCADDIPTEETSPAAPQAPAPFEPDPAMLEEIADRTDLDYNFAPLHYLLHQVVTMPVEKLYPPDEIIDRPSYVDLWDDPEAYRGKVVQVSGRVIRVNLIELEPGRSGLTTAWVVHLFTGSKIMEVIAAKEPLNTKKNAYIRANGLFYKVRRYEDTRGNERYVPVIVARSVQRLQFRRTPSTWSAYLMMTVMVLLVIVFFGVRFYGRRSKSTDALRRELRAKYARRFGSAPEDEGETVECSQCAAFIPVSFTFCPYCGAVVPDKDARERDQEDKEHLAAADELGEDMEEASEAWQERFRARIEQKALGRPPKRRQAWTSAALLLAYALFWMVYSVLYPSLNGILNIIGVALALFAVRLLVARESEGRTVALLLALVGAFLGVLGIVVIRSDYIYMGGHIGFGLAILLLLTGRESRIRLYTGAILGIISLAAPPIFQFVL